MLTGHQAVVRGVLNVHVLAEKVSQSIGSGHLVKEVSVQASTLGEEENAVSNRTTH